MWSNFHTHSDFCDGKSPLEEYADAAAGMGMFSLGFSSHAPLPVIKNWCMRKERLNEYLNAINRLKLSYPEVNIYRGLEIDYIPGKISPRDFAPLLDYTIGSVHFGDADQAGTYIEIDGPHHEFLLGLNQVYKNDFREAVTRYFELTREMIATDCPVIIGHLDKIKIQNVDGKFFQETDFWYKDEVLKTVTEIEKSGAIVEVNTRGIYQGKTSTTYPSPWILEQLKQRHIPVTLSSDAHHPKDLVNYFPEAAALLRKIGYTTVMSLADGQWKHYSFDENGIKLR